MKNSGVWKNYWEKSDSVPDFEFDRGASPRNAETEDLSAKELIQFVDPGASDFILDAGCGAGTNIALLTSMVRRIIGMDYAASAVLRCTKRLRGSGIGNVEVIRGDVRHIPLPDNAVDKVVCISVLQYIDDREVCQALREFHRVTRPGGMVVLHVKNLFSLYLSTLLVAKRLKRFLGRDAKQEYLRTGAWYIRELTGAGYQLVTYNSFNLLMIERMPRRLLEFLQRFEFRHRHKFPLRTGLVRRLGSDFKIKARVIKRPER